MFLGKNKVQIINKTYPIPTMKLPILSRIFKRNKKLVNGRLKMNLTPMLSWKLAYRIMRRTFHRASIKKANWLSVYIKAMSLKKCKVHKLKIFLNMYSSECSLIGFPKHSWGLCFLERILISKINLKLNNWEHGYKK